MRKTLLTLTLALATAAALAAPAILRKNGDCKLQVAGAFDDDKAVAVNLGNADVEIVCKLHGGDFFPRRGVPNLCWLAGEYFVAVLAPGCGP